MKELSLHLLDLAQNSLRAKATWVQLSIEELPKQNELILQIEDNGIGMSEEMLARVTHPFTTSRTYRKVGLGLALVAQMCEACGGELLITSKEQIGTTVTARFKYDHIDCLPIGDVPQTMVSLILGQPEVRYVLSYTYDEKTFVFDTNEIKVLLEEVSIQHLEVIAWIKQALKEEIELLKK